MVNTKTQKQAQKQTGNTVQDLFLNYVKSNGYTVKSYNQLSEKSVQFNGKIKLYYVPLKGGNLKLCLQGVNIPKTEIAGLQVLNQNTYPNKFTQRVYFKGCKPEEVTDFLNNILAQVLPKVSS